MEIKSSKTSANKTPPKSKANNKRLFFIFFSAFVIFFFLCTFVASILTPKIDVPALTEDNNNENVTPMSSNDFRGRIDPRLKNIETTGQNGPATNTDQQAAQTAQDNANVDVNSQKKNTNKVNQLSPDYQNDTNEVPYNSKNSDLAVPTEDQRPQPSDEQQYYQDNPTPKPPVVAKPQHKKEHDDLIIRDKINDDNNNTNTNNNLNE